MDDFDDDPTGTLTFVDEDDDHRNVATQDSQFDHGSNFMYTQASQATGASQFVSQAGENGLIHDDDADSQLEFKDVVDEDEEELTDEEDYEGSTTQGFNEYSMNGSEPAHACKYCGIYEPICVLQCVACRKWFCNSKQGLNNKSHILHHMVKARHNEVMTLAEHPLGCFPISCYHCENKNVFSLGFIPAKSSKVVMFVCRSGCVQAALKKESDYDGEKWQPLIEENQFLKWIVAAPTVKQEEQSRRINLEIARRLEEVWRRAPNATKEDLSRPDYDQIVSSAKLRYSSAVEYKEIMSPIVKEEMLTERETKEAESQHVSQVTWSQNMHHHWNAAFHLPMFADGSMKIVLGDELRLSHTQTLDGSEWSCIGKVCKIPDNHHQKVVITVPASEKIDKSITNGTKISYICKPVWNGITFRRQQEALAAFAANPSACMSSYIYKKLMGEQVDDAVFKVQLPKKWSVPNLPDLNHVQMRVLENVLVRPLSLIQGPPGTGKTGTCASIVYHMSKVMKSQILVCAPSNIATDELAYRIHMTGLKVVRLLSSLREGLEGEQNELSVQSQLMALKNAKDYQKLVELKREFGELSQKDQTRYDKLRTNYEHELLSNADVICCTCSTAADSRLSKFNFKYIVIDESTQATETDVLVALMTGVKQLILVGDHCQLGPVVMSKTAEKAGLQRSLFERLILLGNKPYRLEIQYRMHPALSEFPSNKFYEGSLQNGVSENDRLLDSIINWPVPNKPTFFWLTKGPEELGASGTSYLNRTEAISVEQLATHLMKANVSPEQIGVITPYEGQRSYIVNYMKTQGKLNSQFYEKLEIANVDAFQGREKDIIILTCVRSNANIGIGFLRDPRRLNVAITRAKYGLFIIGNATVLARNPMWNDLIRSYKRKDLIYEGPISNLIRVSPALPQPVGNSRPLLEDMVHSPPPRHHQPSAYPPFSGGSGLVKGPIFRDEFSRSTPANPKLPVPSHIFGAPVFSQQAPPANRRVTPNRQTPSYLYGAGLSQGTFASQASQDFYAPDASSSYMDQPLSGWSQSQSQSNGMGRRSTSGTQPASQDDFADGNLDDYLASQAEH